MSLTRTALIAALVSLAPAIAAADPPGTARVVRPSPRARRAEVHATLVVHGEVQRPQAFDLSGRSRSDYRAPAAESRFTPQVVTATRRNPF